MTQGEFKITKDMYRQSGVSLGDIVDMHFASLRKQNQEDFRVYYFREEDDLFHWWFHGYIFNDKERAYIDKKKKMLEEEDVFGVWRNEQKLKAKKLKNK